MGALPEPGAGAAVFVGEELRTATARADFGGAEGLSGEMPVGEPAGSVDGGEAAGARICEGRSKQSQENKFSEAEAADRRRAGEGRGKEGDGSAGETAGSDEKREVRTGYGIAFAWVVAEFVEEHGAFGGESEETAVSPDGY